MDKTFKKAIAGLLALTLVIGAMPTNSKGFFKEGKVFTAYADGITYSPIPEQDGYFKDSDNNIYKLENGSYTKVTVLTKGSYGENFNYILYSDGTMFMSGSGEMKGKTIRQEDVPYNTNNNDIKKVIIGNGITNIAPNAFANSKVAEVIIPDTVKTIGMQAFMRSTIKTSCHSGQRYHHRRFCFQRMQ